MGLRKQVWLIVVGLMLIGKPRFQAWMIRALVLCMICFMQDRVVAQAPSVPQFDPSDVYFQAYMSVRAAEQLEKDQDFVGALKKYQQASELFDSVGKFYPEWKAGMVKNRRELTSKAMIEVREMAAGQIQRDRKVVAELEGGEKARGELIDPARDVVPLTKGILEVDPLQARRLKEAETELARLREKVKQAEALRQQAKRDVSHSADVRKQNEILMGRLKATEREVGTMRAKMAAAPVEGEMKALNDRIEQLNQEREVMSLALRTSRGEHTEALSKVEILTTDMELMKKQASELRQQQADLQRNLETERKVANEVVAGQRRQMDQMDQVISERTKQLQQAQELIRGLREELDESREAYAELQTERDGLLREREQMAALLKLNESGQIEQLIEQNMGLAKSLREAKEQVKRLNLDSNAAKDDVVDALRNLAIAKSQINRLQTEKREQEKRIAQLTEKLRSEELALASGKVDADPEEVEILREVIRRQLRVQERRRQAKELLVEAVKSLGQEDARLNEAITLFDGTELELTADEQSLVADQNVDGEFVSPYARDRETVGRATARLSVELDSYDRAASKAYLAGRWLSTRELYQLMIEQHPGHIPALCKLGVVQLKLKEPEQAVGSFRKAIELDQQNPYANRMLGYTYMQMHDLEMAEQYLQQALDLAPDDAKSYLLLGHVSYQLGNDAEAESQFKGAIAADPMPSEPYFNLAMICANQDRLKDAREYYGKALERGAVPDRELEAKIRNN